MSEPVRFLSVVFLVSIMISGCFEKDSAMDNDCGVKNVIIMIPDGCSTSIQTLARFYKGSALNLDQLNSGSVRTHAADSVITDSAAAGTAIFTGHKTNRKKYRPCVKEHKRKRWIRSQIWKEERQRQTRRKGLVKGDKWLRSV